MGTQAPSLTFRLALTRLAADPRSLWLVLVLGLLLALPTLDAGLIGDDVAQQGFVAAQLEGRGQGHWWDMFVLVDGDVDRTLGMRRAGRYPWWVDPELRIRFFRPLSVATHYLDHVLWPKQPWLMHLHSVAWYLLACALTWALARRLCSSAAIGTVAAIGFTASYAHLIPVGWLAHRNATIATLCVLGAVWAHHRFRTRARVRDAALAGLLFLLGLLAAELGVAGLGLLVAYALIFDRGPVWVRARSLMPYVLVLVLWRVVYDAFGYGAIGSGAYLDPLGDPLGYLDALPERLGWLLALRFGPPLVYGIPIWSWWMLTGLLALVWLTLVFSCVRGQVAAARVIGFGLLGAVLGLIPMTASIPGDRLLMPTTLGLALAFGELVGAWLFEGGARPRERAAGWLVVVITTIAGPVAWIMSGTALDQQNFAGELPRPGVELPNPDLNRKGLVIVHGRDHLSTSQLPLARAARGLATPNFLWILHTGLSEPEVVRVDARTLELRDPEGFAREPFAVYFRSTRRRPFEVGEQVQTLDYVAEVLEVERGYPTVVRFRFRAPLEHPSFVLAWWDGHDFVPWQPPP